MRQAAGRLWAGYERQLAARPISTKTLTRGTCFLVGDAAAQCISLALRGPGQPDAWRREQQQQQQQQQEQQQEQQRQQLDKERQPPTTLKQEHEKNSNITVNTNNTNNNNYNNNDNSITKSSNNNDDDDNDSNDCFDPVRTLAYGAWGAGYAPLQHYWFNFLSQQTAALSRLRAALCRTCANTFGMVMLVQYPTFYIAVGSLRGDSITECLAHARATFSSVFVADLAYWLPMEYSIFFFVPLRHQVLAFSIANCVFAVVLSTLAQ